MQYNYSLSFIYRDAEGIKLYPDDQTATVVKPLLASLTSPSALVVKQRDNLAYYIFLDGRASTGLQGWVITLNGALVNDLREHLRQSRRCWELLRQQIKASDSIDRLRTELRKIVDQHIFYSDQVVRPINLNDEDVEEILPFSPIEEGAKSKLEQLLSIQEITPASPKVGPSPAQSTAQDTGGLSVWLWLLIAFALGILAIMITIAIVAGNTPTYSSNTDTPPVEEVVSSTDSTIHVGSSEASSYSEGTDSLAYAPVQGTIEGNSDGTEELESDPEQAGGLFVAYLRALAEGRYRDAAEYFDDPVLTFRSQTNLSRYRLYQEMKSYNEANPIESHRILNSSYLNDGSAKFTFIWDRLMQGSRPESYRVTCWVKARYTSEGWKIYSLLENATKLSPPDSIAK